MNARAQPLFHGTHIEITSGTIQSATVTDENGTREDLTRIGEHRFFVEVVEADGKRVSLWDGASHAAAIAQARILSPDFGTVHDLTGETA
ncbi:hypothetical protein [Chelativorans sp. J32]|uniref:hypothetical protein n=1 Tax=Chelativorans sp. J32 TaxID=935840 RepID=UPI00048A410D|nr:hypothetical protein [Chelativorans sp. J32]